MTAPALVLLHAFPVDARMWNGVRAQLTTRTRLITPDQRGLGRTPLPETEREPNLADAARDVVALLDKLEMDRVLLGGCSMGGYVAMSVLREAPERVAGLVLIDTKASADTEEARANRLAMADRVQADGAGGWLADAMLPALLGATSHQQRPEVVATVRELIEAQQPSGVAWAQRAMAARPDAIEALRGVEVPALVVLGEEDDLTPRAEADKMVDALPNGTLSVLPGAGHLTALEDPEALGKTILDWLP
ncbi:MAG: alpha/beta fold hydrolase [Pseudonocardiaceae bacterium]